MPRKSIDMTGWVMKEHGVPNSKLTVIEKVPNYSQEYNLKNKATYWRCKCEYGNEIIAASNNIRRNHTSSCGCKRKEVTTAIDITGKRFERLTVLYPTEKRSGGHVVWQCRCDCGNLCLASISDLQKGTTKSCGCYARDAFRERNSKNILGQRFGKLEVIRYIKSDSKLGQLWECKCDCGNKRIYSTGQLCSEGRISCGCIKSKGEYKIIQFLLQNNIPFEQQKTFSNCLSQKGQKLYFDFYINNNFLLEYDGEQHYFYRNSGWNTEEKYKNTTERDQIKNKYCILNNIPLKRIPYHDYNIFTFNDIMSDKYLIKGEFYAKAQASSDDLLHHD